jgi:hypothetical protein
MAVRLALTEDFLAPGQELSLLPAARAIYLRRGTVEVVSANGRFILHEDSCALAVGAVTLAGDGEAWCFEVAGDWDEAADRARVVLAVLLDRDPAAPVLLRADRVDFPPGAVTPRHGHAGPGIRRLLHGRLLAELGGETRRIEPGQAWFESGDDPVVGRTLAPASAFVRGMALDVALLGRPTFRPWTDHDATLPRAVTARLFLDAVVTLPRWSRR